MSYSDDDEFGPDPDWLDGYTGAQEAKEDHLAHLPPLMPGGESISAQLRRVRQELADGNRFTAGVVDEVSRLEQERDRANELTDKIAAELRGVTRERDALARRLAVRFQALQELTRQLDLADAELASANAELARYRTTPTSKETTMPATNDDGPITDPMITAATEAIWPHLPSEVQESCYEPDAITSWAAAGAAAALRVMADEIDRGPTFSPPPSIISALVRERANRLTDVPDRGAR